MSDTCEKRSTCDKPATDYEYDPRIGAEVATCKDHKGRL